MRPVHLIVAGAALLAAQTFADDVAPSVPPSPDPEVPAAREAAASTAAALTQADVEAWLDGFLPFALRNSDIAGAVVVVVKDGAVLTQKGYGYADVEARKPVDPALTLFRPGSVSKLFTWTAVMQLVEQGKLDLDTDVNKYIDFRIPERDGEPVTLRNIMTHTPGFEEQVKGLMGVGEDGSFESHLKRWTPERIFPAGETPAYSNYATSLAGYIVARVSGMSFDDYLDKHLFAPLEMHNSTFRQPLPERLAPHMSKGYPAASLPEKPFEIVGPAPAGSLSAPGADMANFMIAHLQKGRFGAAQILKPETAEMMHGTALTILPRVHRMVLGFYEANANGRRVIAHGGDTQWFHSDLNLFIDDGVGLYISMNSSGKEGASGDVRAALLEQFADRYLPGKALDGGVDPQVAAEHARMIAGAYGNSRRMDSSFLSLLNLVGPLKVSANDDDTIGLSMVTSPSGVPLKWREVEPFVWRLADSDLLLAAEVQDSRVARFSFEPLSPFMMFEPEPAWKASSWLLPTLIAALAAALLTTIAWPASALTRRHYRAQYALSGQDAKAHRLVRVAAVTVVVVWIGWIATIGAMMSNFSLFSPELDGWLWLLQLVSLLAFFGAVGVGGWNAWVVLRSGRSWYAKAWALVLAASFLAMLWVALTHHLIAFDVNY